MSSASRDPLDWTVDEVVKFLCHTIETPWSNAAVKNRPDPVSFETALRENFITGETLLHDVDLNNLREDLGINALGHRSSVIRAISYLRERSFKYQSTQEKPKAQYESHQDDPPAPFYLDQWSTPHLGTSQHENARKTPSIPMSNNVLSSGPESSQNMNLENRKRTGFEADGGSESDKDADNRVESRPKETVVVDNQGRKRRRLQLSPQAPEAVSEPLLEEWYMGPHKVEASQLFYPFTSDENDQPFVMVGGEFPTGLRAFVKKSLHFFFKQRPVHLKSEKGKQYWGVFPYKTPNEDKQKFFTLYTSKKGKVTVCQEDMRRWPEFNKPETSAEGLDPSDPFAQLLQKYPAEKDDPEGAFPVYGESGSEGEYDEETWGEINNDQQDPEHEKSKRLSRADVESIINASAIEIETKWHENRKPKEEQGARKLWLQAKHGKSTNRLVKVSTKELQLQERRLRKVQDTIRENEYYSTSELWFVCQTMEYPIFNITKQKWRISVLGLEQCPPKIASTSAKRLKPKSRPRNGDEESLSPESDFISDDEPQGDLDQPMDSDVDDQVQYSANSSATRSPARQRQRSNSSDYDIISPSGKARKSRKSDPIPLSLRSSPEVSDYGTATELVDLTMDTPPPDDLNIETPPLNPVSAIESVSRSDGVPAKSERSSISPGPRLGTRVSVEIPKPKRESTTNTKTGLPEMDDFDALAKLDWTQIEEKSDKGRLLAKLVGGLPDEERKSMVDALPTYGVTRLKHHVRDALNALSQSEGTVHGLSPSKNQLVMRTASLFISYVNCIHLSQEGISKHQIVNAQMDLSGFTSFFDVLCKVLGAYYDQKQDQDAVVVNSTPHKKRKKEVKESQHVKMNQESAQERVMQQEIQKEKLQTSLGTTGASNDDPRQQVVSFSDPVIYLHEHNGSRVKPHQLSGVQFMWRELIQDEKHQGCLLAHTMGLGKTMQVYVPKLKFVLLI